MSQYLNHAVELHMRARELQNDSLEGAEHIRTLAEQALREPALSRKLLAEIAATAENTVRSCEDAVSTFSVARVSVRHARACMRGAERIVCTQETE